MLFFLFSIIKFAIFITVLPPMIKDLVNSLITSRWHSANCENDPIKVITGNMKRKKRKWKRVVKEKQLEIKMSSPDKCPNNSASDEESVPEVRDNNEISGKRKNSKGHIKQKQLEERRSSTDKRWNLKKNKQVVILEKEHVEKMKKEVEDQLEKVRRERARIIKMQNTSKRLNNKWSEEQIILEKKAKIKERLAEERKKYLVNVKLEEEMKQEETEKKKLEAENRIQLIVKEVKERLCKEMVDKQLSMDKENSQQIRDEIIENAPCNWHPSLIGMGLEGLEKIFQKEQLRVSLFVKHIEDDRERIRQTSALLNVTDHRARMLDGIMILESRLKNSLNTREWIYHRRLLNEWIKHHHHYLLDIIMEDMANYGVLKGKELDMYNFLLSNGISMETFFDFVNVETPIQLETTIPTPMRETYTYVSEHKQRKDMRQPFAESHTLKYKAHRRSKFTSVITV